MIERLAGWAVRNPGGVMLGAVLLVGGGGWAMQGLRVDAFPDLTDANCAAAASWGVRRGANWVDGDDGVGISYHDYTPNSPSPDCLRHSNPGWKAERSRHPGGGNVLFADGHVQFVKDAVDRATWQGRATRKGGEVIGTDRF